MKLHNANLDREFGFDKQGKVDAFSDFLVSVQQPLFQKSHSHKEISSKVKVLLNMLQDSCFFYNFTEFITKYNFF